MLIRITDSTSVDERKLMDVYADSNSENTACFCPEESDPKKAVRIVEEGFLNYLKNEFLASPGNAVWVLEKDGIWLSALRTTMVSEGLYYLEALETRPDSRKMGYGSELLSAVISALKETGAFRLCDCVGKANSASLKTHERCGFVTVSEEGYDYLQGETDPGSYGLEYKYQNYSESLHKNQRRRDSSWERKQ